MATASKVLVIGASGFVGRSTVARLAFEGFEVVALRHAAVTPQESTERIRWIQGDLREPSVSKDWPESCDHVVYLAQSPRWRQFPDGAGDVFAVNTAGVFNAIEYAVRAGSRSFVLASTGSVYAGTGSASTENDEVPVDQPGFYAASKAAAECLVAPFANLLAVVRLRIYTPYGPHQNESMLIPSLVRRVRESIPIELHGRDGMVISPLYVDDLAEAISRCIALERSAVINVAGPERLALRQLGECIGRVLGMTPRFTTRENEPAPVAAGDCSKLREVLGWAPDTSLEAGLRKWLVPGNDEVSRQ